jgi:hypothetical protein
MANAATASKNTKKNAAANHVQPGPRGFRFGYTYVQSVIDAGPIASKEANKAKLVAFAKEIGVEGVTMKTDIETALKSMKKAATKFRNTHWEAPTVH